MDQTTVDDASERVRLIVLRCPYVNWKVQGVPEHFTAMVDLKLEGYLSKHQIGAMPLDASDFVADHLLFYQGDRLVMGAKSLRFDLCKTFHVDFPIESFLNKGNHGVHLSVLSGIQKKVRENRGCLSYYSSWTISPKARVSPAAVLSLKEVFTSASYWYHQSEGITDVLGAGLPKFRTDQFFASWGFQPFVQQGEELPSVAAPIFRDIQYVAMHLTKFSPAALSLALRHRDIWRGRRECGSPFFSKGPTSERALGLSDL